MNDDSRPPDSLADAAAVHALAEALRLAVNCSDVNGIVACWARDGVLMPPSRAAVHGREAIRQYFARVFDSRRLHFTFTDSRVEVFGDVAIEQLHYTVVATASDGETTDDAGKGIHVCRRRADGTWQLAQDIWNSDRR